VETETTTATETTSSGQRKLKGQKRLRLVAMGFAASFLAIGLQLGYLSVYKNFGVQENATARYEPRLPRPNIVDRNGVVMATDISVPSLFAEPNRIIDVDEAVELLTATDPELDARVLRKKLSQSKKGFVWVKREVSPELREEIFNLGIPGIGFRSETKRIYPMGRLGAHVLGYVDLDSIGIAGIEKYLDDQGAIYTASLADPESRTTTPAYTSLDIRVQHAVTDELQKAIIKFRAKGGGGIVMDIESGEVIAMVSLPDFNPNATEKNFSKLQNNMMTSGVFELGSVIKAVTFAMAFDYGVTDLNGRYDARVPLVIGRSRISDFHAQRRVLTVPEVFTNSSNIGTAKMALETGLQRHKEFLTRVGLMDRLTTELPESAKPLLPQRWSKIASATAAFGHGFAVQPLQGLDVVSGLLNNGLMIPPTFIKRDKETARALGKQIVKPETSEKMRYLFRLNATEGSAAKADVVGYRVGGKTGTAEKVVNGRYAKDKRLASFIGAFPMDAPRYSILIMLDEPQALPETYGFATSGWNAVPTAGKVIARIAPILGIDLKLTPEDREKLEKQAKAEAKAQAKVN
jgi:cell division protein FtsI (penicillin-binding protein 3)